VVVRIANITIRDIGYANTNNTGDQETMANSGTAFTLKGISLSFDRGTGVDNSENPGRYEDTEINYTSQGNGRITIRGTLKYTESGDIDQIKDLDDVVITKGLKILYYSSSTDGFKTFIDALGQATLNSVTVDSTIKFLLVRFTSINFSQGANSQQISYTLTAEVTNG
jgi:hypothetical protein